jgi:flagellin-specific chaperone FliS
VFQDLEAAAPDRAIPATYDRLCSALRGALESHAAGDPVQVKHELDAALSLVFSLLGTLNYKEGGELAPRLGALYGYFASEILVLMHAMDTASLDRVIEMVDILNGQWRSSSEYFMPTTQ